MGLALNPTLGRQSETIGSYSYTLATADDSPRAIRAAVLRGLREPLEPETLRVRSSVIPEPLGLTP